MPTEEELGTKSERSEVTATWEGSLLYEGKRRTLREIGANRQGKMMDESRLDKIGRRRKMRRHRRLCKDEEKEIKKNGCQRVKNV